MKKLIFSIILFFIIFKVEGQVKKGTITGELKKWHKVTITFNGPATSETDHYNPFFNYRLNVTFTHRSSGKQYEVPGYFAADGNAAHSSASQGSKWRVHFSPDESGEWQYEVHFRKGKWVAIREKRDAGESAGYMDGAGGSFSIDPTDKSGRDMRSKGRLQYVGQRYLKFAETGEYFLKFGTDAPENLLAYEDFDGTFKNDGHKDKLVKSWKPHIADWASGDPMWKNGKGKGLIGAVNYLASEGVNALSFLTMNIAGDDRNVFPYINYDTYDRFDVSKLDQWEMVFEYAQKKGIFLHFKTLEAENQGLLDHGAVGANTKLYYRELIARFGHHLALNWNLGEESGDWVKNPETVPMDKHERRAMAQYFYEHDPYQHHIVIHNGALFDDLLGDKSKLTGISLQTNTPTFKNVHDWVKKWIRKSAKAGKPWAVAVDEPGDAQHGLLPDVENKEHDNARKNGLWGAMMAGAWGTEWYFGYNHPHSDLTAQDFRSRDLFWDQGRYMMGFFTENKIPFWQMDANDELISSSGDYCLAKEGELYIVYLKNGGNQTINLKNNSGVYSIYWYNPRRGGVLQEGSKHQLSGNGKQSLGLPPHKDGQDWVVFVRAEN